MRVTVAFTALCMIAVSVSSTPTVARAQDVEGSKDHPMFSRVPGYQITLYDAQDFAKFELSVDPPKTVEGKYWRIEYALKEGGKKVGPLQIGRSHTDLFVKRGGKRPNEDLSAGGGVTVANWKAGGKTIWVQVDVNNSGESFTLTVVEEAAMEQLVEFSAMELAAALADKGSVALHNVLFETGKATLLASSTEALAPVGELLKSDPSLTLEIQGHTDNVGMAAANLKLSQERALAVKAHLVQTFGISAARLTTAGFGDTKPLGDNTSDAGRAQNRRVELVKK